jgi:hypothetical protein
VVGSGFEKRQVLPDGPGFILARQRAAEVASVQAEDWFADVRAKAGR